MHKQNGTTALIVAAQQGHIEVATLLLDRKANIESANKVSYDRVGWVGRTAIMT